MRSRYPLELQTISAHWQRALDAAGGALDAASGSLLALGSRAPATRAPHESDSTPQRCSHAWPNVTGARPTPWLSPVPVNTTMLGLPNHVRACVFDVEGVLTNGGALHAWAWGEVFDDVLLQLSEQTGWHFIPFDRIGDYRAFFDGRARLEGIHLFLESRGIRLPEGRVGRPGRGAYRLRPGQAKGRAARGRCACARRGRAPRRRSLPRGGRTRAASGVRWSRRAPARYRCWNSRGSRR